jgi:hypothetical protein
MTHWKVAWGVMLVLGLSSAPLLAYGQVEGSMSGHPPQEKQEKTGKMGMTKEEGVATGRRESQSYGGWDDLSCPRG